MVSIRPLLCIGLSALLTSLACGGGSGSPPPPPPPPKVTVAIAPTTATVPVGTIQPFLASASSTTSSAVTWKASDGTIDQSGNYTAPLSVPAGGIASVTATSTASPSASASAVVTITMGPVALTMTPSTATLKAGFSERFTATVSGTTNQLVEWSLTELPGDSTYPGSLDRGTYTAPSPFLTPDTFTVSAVSNADPTKMASASVRVVPLENQEQQPFPIKLGASGMNANTAGYCCSGTLGSLLVDQKGKQYVLSNNHVLGRNGSAAPGEPIVQPGFVDTQCDFTLPKTVANFTIAPPLASNVDAAIAQVAPGAVDSQGEIIGLGGVASDGAYIPAPPANTTVAPVIGMPVAKSGRTTGLTCGTVTAINAGILVGIEPVCGTTISQQVTFHGQVVVGGGFAHPGDSGSLIVEAGTARPLALVAAGSADGSYTTANPVTDVLTALNSSSKGSTFSFVGAGQHSVSCSALFGSSQQASVQESTQAESSVIPTEEIARVMDVQRKYESEVMLDPAVIGMAIGKSDVDPRHASILVFVETGKVAKHLPITLDGVAVRVIRSGPFRAILEPATAAASRCASGVHRPGEP
jgi:hypothetical protein